MSWISNELEAVYKIIDKMLENKELKDDIEAATDIAIGLAINRMIRKPVVAVNQCPSCRRPMMVKNNFCPECGQALDWQQEG